MYLRPLALSLLVASLALFSPVAHAASKLDVLISSTVEPDYEGQPVPTAEQPVYYIPISSGYTQRGQPIAGEDEVPTKRVWPQIKKVLAEQGYLVANRELKPMPKLILVFQWGTLNPLLEDNMIEDPTGENATLEFSQVSNLNEMLYVTGGFKALKQNVIDQEDALARATENRYYVIVSAYDLAISMQPKVNGKRQKKLVWRTCISVPSRRTDIFETLTPMIAQGSRYFGRTTDAPIEVEAERAGSAIPGAITVIDVVDDKSSGKSKNSSSDSDKK